MLRYLIFLCGLCATCCTCHRNTTPAVAESNLWTEQTLPLAQPLTTLAFGSCNRQDKPQNYWPTIQRLRPDLWIWLGDNIYGDTESMATLQEKYQLQKSNPAYRAFRDDVPVIGTWDDHDYGVNDGGKAYPHREESAQLALDFLDVPLTDAARSRPGLYQSYTFGPVGQRVKVILLDTRYFRDPLEPNPGGRQRYKPNETGDILGEGQWTWLEEELTNSTAQVHLIASSIQVIPTQHAYEKWSNFPTARQRLFDLLQAARPARPVLLSGDRHLAEVSRLVLPGLDQPLYEVTSSGLTHSYESADESNQYRITPLIGQRNFGILRVDWTAGAPNLHFTLYDMRGTEYFSLAL